MVKWSLNKPLFGEHMSFVIGPRQCGKTTATKDYLTHQGFAPGTHYFNWDDAKVTKAQRASPYWFEGLQEARLRVPIVFDEIHKRRLWKRYLKGAYDTYREQFFFIVTGSGRLDHYQRGGDSLAGRYDTYRLYPLTPGEIDGVAPQSALTVAKFLEATPVPAQLVTDYLALGGFPEPFLTGSEAKTRRWWDQYQQRVTEEDLRELTSLQSVDLARQILALLPERVASPLSLNSIREQVECSHATVDRYVRTLYQLFLCFDVPPYSKRVHRAVKKEKKLYFYHHPAVLDPGARLENSVALVLHKWCSGATERAEGQFTLHYIRDQDRREVDFLICDAGRPMMLFEVKTSDTQMTPALKHFSDAFKVPAIQVVATARTALKREHGAVIGLDRLSAVCG